jgi:hypothetical protein
MPTIFFVGKPEGMRPLGRPPCRLDDNIRMDLNEIGWEGVEWMHLTPDRYQWQVVVNTVMKFQGNFFTFLVAVSFSRRTTLHVVSYPHEEDVQKPSIKTWTVRVV